MSKEIISFSIESGGELAITYTCSKSSCMNPVGQRNFEVVTLVYGYDIPETMSCPACGGEMRKSNVTIAGGVPSEIWT